MHISLFPIHLYLDQLNLDLHFSPMLLSPKPSRPAIDERGGKGLVVPVGVTGGPQHLRWPQSSREKVETLVAGRLGELVVG